MDKKFAARRDQVRRESLSKDQRKAMDAAHKRTQDANKRNAEKRRGRK